MSSAPKVYVWCNRCAHDWHEFNAMAEDGTYLAGHICSNHAYAGHDMGLDENGWKRDLYAAHYPDGFEVELVKNAREHAGLQAAYKLNQAKREEPAQ